MRLVFHASYIVNCNQIAFLRCKFDAARGFINLIWTAVGFLLMVRLFLEISLFKNFFTSVPEF
jgi:hypothetical protein